MVMETIMAADMAWGTLPGDDFLVEDLIVVPEEQEEFQQEAATAEADDDESSETCNQYNATSTSATSLELKNPSAAELEFHSQEDVAELEWVSRFYDDSYFKFPSFEGGKCPLQVQAPPTACRWLPAKVPVKARSKRPRTANCGLWSNKSTTPDSSSNSSSACSSISSGKTPEKRRGRKKKRAAAAGEGSGIGFGVGGGAREQRRCSHCGSERTPQWRAGPEGAKTLCNACGVRFKSGRLLPEYRPAASPTFVGSVHSNSHRRVLEMRRKKEEQEQEQEQLLLVGF